MDNKTNPNELIKANSRFLRGTLKQSMDDPLTGALAADDAQISKFHGFYEQDDRDQRLQRTEHFLEPYYSFMLRARLPGGVCTPKQWLAIDYVGRELGNGSIRLTTRQTFQYHGILKKHLKSLIKRINQAMIDSIGGCGDVNRNVLCNPNPECSALHAAVYGWARCISEHLLPKTNAYHEIWLDGKPVTGSESEPIYGNTYLPRKFKTAVAIPPHNDVDVYTNDLGFIAIVENGRLEGFNVLAGGGMGTTHDDPTTYPRLADELGFIAPEDTLTVAEAIVTIQRDFGNRISRRHARLKYTIERMGLDEFVTQVETRSGVEFKSVRPVQFDTHGDRYGWVENPDHTWHLTLYIENGRIEDRPDVKLLQGLRRIAEIHQGDFRITPNQNLVVANISKDQKNVIEAIAHQHSLLANTYHPTRLASIACVALPTCPQAMAEAERYFPDLLSKVELLAEKYAIEDSPIVIRMTGCPNGCARPYVAEIGLIGKGPGRYNLHLGGDGRGLRLNRLYRKNLNETDLLNTLDKLLQQYAANRNPEERFGDYVVRSKRVNLSTTSVEDHHETV
ncbi:MAG: assimilatory sulfite reductase (NADPH) hemoprotein subunit [Candidatus Thiodiazotropha sp.]|nr:assimilatory sulfite reductase (NADPH) hemoprotein subunit [Candidatus Thiodiazotropha sp.]MCM8882798.1 assimilatory sulfite reductase (NADPH) hemoprotein subunit [Candidatus Thiodiazotropha sp.]